MSLFTKIINGEIPSSKVADGDTWYAFLDINPRSEGHTLVVPKEEKQRIADLTPESRAALLDGVVEVQRKLGAHFKTTDFTVAVHDGPAAGQEVPHVHIHVIPRLENDGGLALPAMFPKVKEHSSLVPIVPDRPRHHRRLPSVLWSLTSLRWGNWPRLWPRSDRRRQWRLLGGNEPPSALSDGVRGPVRSRTAEHKCATTHVARPYSVLYSIPRSRSPAAARKRTSSRKAASSGCRTQGRPKRRAAAVTHRQEEPPPAGPRPL